jgi:hypothetical protein
MRRKPKPDVPDFRSPGERLLGITRRPAEPLESVVFDHHLETDQFLELLNKPDDDDVYASVALRAWVDEWLNSGRTPEGVEDARERSFNFAPHNVGQAADDFTKRWKIRLAPSSQRIKLKVEPDPLFRHSHEDRATERLILFLLSDLRFKLAKCRIESCGQYFILNHWKRTYKRGTLCATCQRLRSLQSAAQSTAEARHRAEEKLYELAAKRFGRRLQSNDNWAQDAALNEQMIEYLNSEIKANAELSKVYPKDITKKWLGWEKNQMSIEAAVGGKDGESHGTQKAR